MGIVLFCAIPKHCTAGKESTYEKESVYDDCGDGGFLAVALRRLDCTAGSHPTLRWSRARFRELETGGKGKSNQSLANACGLQCRHSHTHRVPAGSREIR